jgi:CRP/FNR family transcriptional regulator, anaerobic regulatory protein
MLAIKESDFQETYPFWEKLTRLQKDVLMANSRLVPYKKNSFIYEGEKECLGLLAIKKGSVRIYINSEEGKEITLYRLYAGDVEVLSAYCVISEITFDVNISAEEDCEVLITNAYTFGKILKENIHLENFTHRLANERFSDVMWVFQQILFMSVEKRIAIFLLDEVNANNTDTVSITHEQIAKYIGSAREVVTRTLKQFANDDMISINRGKIKVLDKKKIKNIALQESKKIIG